MNNSLFLIKKKITAKQKLLAIYILKIHFAVSKFTFN